MFLTRIYPISNAILLKFIYYYLSGKGREEVSSKFSSFASLDNANVPPTSYVVN